MRVLVILTFFLSSFSFAYQIGPKSFYQTINSNKLVLVKFWASWCMPCSILKPEFEKAKKKMGKKVIFAEYNVDLGGKALRQYNISLLPTMILFKNGKELDRTSDILDNQTIIEWIGQYQ